MVEQLRRRFLDENIDDEDRTTFRTTAMMNTIDAYHCLVDGRWPKIAKIHPGGKSRQLTQKA